jgi:hypothetical protein
VDRREDKPGRQQEFPGGRNLRGDVVQVGYTSGWPVLVIHGDAACSHGPGNSRHGHACHGPSPDDAAACLSLARPPPSRTPCRPCLQQGSPVVSSTTAKPPRQASSTEQPLSSSPRGRATARVTHAPRSVLLQRCPPWHNRNAAPCGHPDPCPNASELVVNGGCLSSLRMPRHNGWQGPRLVADALYKAT